MGVVDAAAVARARSRQRAMGPTSLTLGELLIQAGAVEEGTLVRTLAQEAAVPIVQLGNFDITEALLALVPADVAVLHGVLPLTMNGGRGKKSRGVLHLAMVDPCDEQAVNLVRELTQLDVRRAIALPSEIRAAIDELYAIAIDALDEGEVTLEIPAGASPPPLPSATHVAPTAGVSAGSPAVTQHLSHVEEHGEDTQPNRLPLAPAAIAPTAPAGRVAARAAEARRAEARPTQGRGALRDGPV